MCGTIVCPFLYVVSLSTFRTFVMSIVTNVDGSTAIVMYPECMRCGSTFVKAKGATNVEADISISVFLEFFKIDVVHDFILVIFLRFQRLRHPQYSFSAFAQFLCLQSPSARLQVRLRDFLLIRNLPHHAQESVFLTQ